jgi:tetratricopeptide (TPR) repeat protein
MNTDSLLTKAARLVRRKKYGETIRLLEPEVVRYHDSFRYYYILAYSCLLAGDFGGALTYFRRAREIRMRDPAILIGLAALHLRRGETDRAVDLYLDVLDKEPRNRLADRALNVVRKKGDPETLAAWIEGGNLPRLYPPPPELPFSPRRLVFASTVIILGAVLLFAAAFTLGFIRLPTAKAATRPGFEDTGLGSAERADPVQVGGSYAYVLTRKQVLDTYDAAQRLFREYRDEAAKVELNRILESNASEQVKVKARILASYAVAPGFDTLKDRYTYSVVSASPMLYRGVHVIWRGMAANLKEEDKSTSFDLLVGYDTKNSLEGIVAVRFDFSIAIDQERPLEVLGRIVPVNGGEGKLAIQIEGVALHQSASLGEGKK